MIELLDVCKRYGAVAAVDGVSLQVAPGSITVLVGASGSGKSTLLRLVNRLIELDGGRILLDGADTRNGPPELLRRRIGYVIQSTGLFPHWTVARNIATVPRLLDWPAARIRTRVDELLDLLALDPALFRDRYPHQLSGGEQQRVGVARALAARPSVLLMDEPFAALDPLTRQALQRQLAQIQRALQTTVLMVTHDIDEALLLGHQLVLLHQGKVVQAGTPRQLLMNPASERVAAFFGTTAIELRRLEFRTVGELMRRGESADGPPLQPEQSLQRALVAFLAARCDRLAVADREGRTIGAIRFADLLGPAAS